MRRRSLLPWWSSSRGCPWAPSGTPCAARRPAATSRRRAAAALGRTAPTATCATGGATRRRGTPRIRRRPSQAAAGTPRGCSPRRISRSSRGRPARSPSARSTILTAAGGPAGTRAARAAAATAWTVPTATHASGPACPEPEPSRRRRTAASTPTTLRRGAARPTCAGSERTPRPAPSPSTPRARRWRSSSGWHSAKCARRPIERVQAHAAAS
mmetsp:Transcript_69745/g.150260  ORF Transcript_69745/g.150260 Transcript_69745/m.150260 type:complete len:213 (-) Transcript_69745:272-910(-)